MDLTGHVHRRSRTVEARWLSMFVMCVLSVGCSGPTDPEEPPPQPKQLQIACPTPPQAAESISGAPIAVSYPSPLVSGGAQPVTTTCSPASGASFPVGSSAVSCTAVDVQQRTAACSFSVTVNRPGLLSATRFLAFGDSMTEGALPGCQGTSGVMTGEFLLRDLAMVRAAVNIPSSYPNVLGTLLTTRYVTQSPTVTNVGLSGERVSDASGTNGNTMTRLRNEMALFAPNIVFLFEGVNDMNANLLHPEVTIPAVVKGLRDMAREALQRGAVKVFIATLPPQQSSACRAYSAAQIPALNDQIRVMVAADRHVLVDVYDAFGGVAAPFIGVDGLHPNQLGYQKIAQTFLEKIRASLEVPR